MSKPRHPRCPACRCELSTATADPPGKAVCPECGKSWTLSEIIAREQRRSVASCGSAAAIVLATPLVILWIAYPFVAGSREHIVSWCGFAIFVPMISWFVGAVAATVSVLNRVLHKEDHERRGAVLWRSLLVALAWVALPLGLSWFTVYFAGSIIANI